MRDPEGAQMLRLRVAQLEALADESDEPESQRLLELADKLREMARRLDFEEPETCR